MAEAQTDTFAAILKELALLLRPIAVGMESPSDTDEIPPFLALLLEQAGIQLDEAMGASTVTAIRTHLTAIADAYDVIAPLVERGTLPELSELPAIGRELGNAFNALKALSEVEVKAYGPDELLVDLEELGQLVLEYLLAEYLFTSHPTLYNALTVVGIIDPGDDEATTLGGKLTRVRMRQLVEVLRDPQNVMKTMTYWGTEAFDPYRIMVPMAFLLHSLGFPAVLAIPAAADAEALGWDGESETGVDLALRIPLVREESTVEAQVGFSLLPLRAEAGHANGLALVPYGVGSTGQRIELGGNWEFDYRVSGNVTVRYGLVMDFDATELRALDAGSSLPAAATLKSLAAVRRTSEEGKRFQIIAQEGLGVFEVGNAGVHVGFEFEGGKAAFFVEVPLRDARLALKADKADGFLQKVLPDDGFEQKFDVTIGWSSKSGPYLREGVGKDDFESGRGLEGSGASATPSATARSLARTRALDGGGAKKGDGLATTVSVKADLLGIIQVDSVDLTVKPGTDEIKASAASTVAVTLGPVKALVEKMGIEAKLTFPDSGGNLGIANLDLDFKSPAGAALSIEAAAVSGGGYLFFDEEKQQYAGIVELKVAGKIALKAIGLITTKMPDGSRGFSLFLLVTAEGFAPLQLGLGFTLNGVGGLLGVNRTVMTEVLRAGLRQGTLDSILFPPDPLRNAPTIISNLNSVFPPARGRYLFGPMVILGWGTPTVVTLKMALILEIPEPVRLIMLGRLSVLLPTPEKALVKIQIDTLGELNFQAGTLSLDGLLFDSRLLDFPLTGSMALRAGWGDRPHFLLSIGGFNPRFPVPAGLPKLDRLSLTLANKPNLKLRLEGYLAITSNTLQFGARVELFAKAGAISVDGYLGFDTLIQFSPFSFITDIAAGVALRYNKKLIAAIQLAVVLSGPTPWHIRGSASIKVLFIEYSIDIDYRFGPERPPELPEPIDVGERLHAALVNPDHWSAELPAEAPPLVALREVPGAGLVAHPLARLSVRQKVVPLGETISRFGASRPSGARRFEVDITLDSDDVALNPSDLHEYFAMGQFLNWSDEEKLRRPSFEQRRAGYQLGGDALDYDEGEMLGAAISYEEITLQAEPLPA